MTTTDKFALAFLVSLSLVVASAGIYAMAYAFGASVDLTTRLKKKK